jgi:hypothetical protein
LGSLIVSKPTCPNNLFRVCSCLWNRARKVLKSVNVKTTMFVFIVELGFPVMAIIVGYEAQSIPSPSSIKPST